MNAIAGAEVFRMGLDDLNILLLLDGSREILSIRIRPLRLLQYVTVLNHMVVATATALCQLLIQRVRPDHLCIIVC